MPQLGPACDGAARGGQAPAVVIPGTSSGVCPLPSLSLRWCFGQGIWSFPLQPPTPCQAEERGPCPQLPGTTQLACFRGHLQTARHSPCWASTLPVLLPGPGFWNIVGP